MFKRASFVAGALITLASLAFNSIGQTTSQALLTRIAFGSCARENQPQPIWEKIIATKPDLFLFTGDNIYGDSDDVAVLKAKYDKLTTIPGFRQLRQQVPLMATWDDHDYGLNDGGAEFSKRAESQKLLLDFFNEPADSPRRKQEGVYDAKSFGPTGRRVQVILLDTRYHRSPLKLKAKDEPGIGRYTKNEEADATMLGAAQWKWLAEQLKQPAEIRLIASSVQVVAEDHGFEKWMNFPLERERLFNLIREAKASGVIFLSGDRHLAELSMMDGGVGYPLYDLTSSGINNANQSWRFPEFNRRRVMTMNKGDHFGLITVNWNETDPRIALQIHDLDGDVTIQHKLKLSELKPGFLK